MLTGRQLKLARQHVGLTWAAAARYLGVHWRTVARWESTPGILSRCIEIKAQRLLWDAARTKTNQALCATCHGTGLVMRSWKGEAADADARTD